MGRDCEYKGFCHERVEWQHSNFLYFYNNTYKKKLIPLQYLWNNEELIENVVYLGLVPAHLGM